MRFSAASHDEICDRLPWDCGVIRIFGMPGCRLGVGLVEGSHPGHVVHGQHKGGVRS
jgi:hypothetical protein